MKRILKVLGFLVLAIVVAAVAAFVWIWRSVPPGDGEIGVADLAAPVSILRDRNGIPHIQASSAADAYAAMGFVHAQDRLWQMEVARMAGQGRLSEMFGAATVGTDIWLRTMGFAESASASFDTLDPVTQEALEAYARGVNAWLERKGRFFASRLPPEFVILGHEPEPWRPQDCIIALKMLSVTLATNVGEEAERLAFARLGFDAAAIEDLLPPIDGDAPPPLPDLAALLELEDGPLDEAKKAAMLDFSPVDAVMGTGASNNWVVSGSQTESGLPILANDPHLGLAAPSIWYLVDLRVDDGDAEPRNVIGATNPGSPFVLLGRNTDVAWGFTNTNTDVQDIFVEKVNPDNADEYLTPDGWQAFGSKEERIRVSGGDDVVFTRRWTRHGPVLPKSYRHLDLYLPEGSVAALQWTALAADDTTADAARTTFENRTVAGFQNAMRPYVAPMQSMVIADRSGNIGLIAPGRVPIRDRANLVRGRAPVPGWLDTYDWKDTISFWQLPRRYNPEGGRIATANTKIVDAGYPHFLTYDWDEPYRQQRIDALLDAADGPHTAAVSRAIQADIDSAPARELTAAMLAAIEGQPGSNGDLAERLAAWDGRMTAGSMEPLVFMAWLRETMRAIFADDIGPAYDDWLRARGKVLLRVLSGEASRNWCDDAGTPAEEACPEIVSRALTAALADLEKRYGQSRDSWRWGKAHVARSMHTPFGKVPALAWLFNVEIESGGGQFTLDRGAPELENEADPFVNRHASSMRAIYDLSDLDKSTFIQTTGQSGNVFSPHYRDFAGLWQRVEAVRIPADPAAYEGDIEGRWELRPAGGT